MCGPILKRRRTTIVTRKGSSQTVAAVLDHPGAFPPVQLTDVDRLLERRSLKWTSRSQFISKNFREQIRAGVDPTSFVDGSIVNDKPFSAGESAPIATSTVGSSISIRTPGWHLPRRTGGFQASYRRWRLLSLKFHCMPRSMESWRGLLNSTSRSTVCGGS